MATKSNKSLNVETIRHLGDRRRIIPTAEYESIMKDEDKTPIQVAYERRNRDLDPQLVWRGKDEQNWSDLVVAAPPLYIQEKVHPKVLIEDLRQETQSRTQIETSMQMDLFADFNGIPENATATDFYQHDANWTNRMILGDSLQVMASLAEREGLLGKVQCIFIDPPYGIKFNSNFQWSTTSRDVKDGKNDHITREPEQVKAFRDTWRDGIHSYLTYLRDRLTVARDLLTHSGSVFIQIGDENVHRVRAVMDEVFGDENFMAEIAFAKTTSSTSNELSGVFDVILWFAKSKPQIKFRNLYLRKVPGGPGGTGYRRVRTQDGEVVPVNNFERPNGTLKLPHEATLVFPDSLRSQSPGSRFDVHFRGKTYRPEPNYWKTDKEKFPRLILADRIYATSSNLSYLRRYDDFPVYPLSNFWADTVGQNQFGGSKLYVVQTGLNVIQRCLLMTTDPGDLVLDPTCGSGSTAYVAEQWGRRWITIDTSRVALALARARIMGARYPYYLLADSPAGQHKEAEVTRTAPSTAPTYNNVRQGFVYERVPHIMLKDIANNAEIDVIWERFQEKLEPLRAQLNAIMNKAWEEWEIPRRAEDPWADDARTTFRSLRQELKKGDVADRLKVQQLLHILNQKLKRNYTADTLPRRPADPWPKAAADLHAQWWEQRITRQREIDASIATQSDQEFLYDKPYEDRSVVRVAGPFTVESLSPHRILTVDTNDELVIPDELTDGKIDQGSETDFTTVILENLRTAGVQQSHKEDRITFTSLTGWPGHYLCAEGRYIEGESNKEKRAGIFIGPEFGTVPRADLVAAAREAADAGFDVVIACAFNYDAQSSEFDRLGRIPVLKARMNADLHMADALKNTGAGNLFVVFGEPDIDIQQTGDNQVQVQIHGVDIFHPQSGEVRSSDPDDIACWFIDTNYNEESFFVRHAYFLGANDPYKALKTTLKAEVDLEAWASLHSDISRPFPKPETGRIAVKVINHLGDEVMKVFGVE